MKNQLFIGKTKVKKLNKIKKKMVLSRPLFNKQVKNDFTKK